MDLPRPLDVASSGFATVLRLGLGLRARDAGPRPEQTLELYEFEACPFCRKVREALTMLDLPVLIYPCPKGGPNYRPELVARGGKAQFPYLVDPNRGEEMYESGAIVRYLYTHYGKREAPWYLVSDISILLGSFASGVRLARGFRYRAARRPEQPLELFGFESSPYTRLAREALCELELPYRLTNAGVGSPSWRVLKERSGAERVMVPWLSDPNTGVEMFESADIVAYLRETYGE